MAPVLVEQLHHLGRQLRGESCEQSRNWAAVAEDAAEMTLWATQLFLRLEAAGAREQTSDPREWNEAAARKYIPVFQEWFDYATALKELRNDCKAHGHTVEGGVEFLHAYNRAKMMALHFDSILETTRKIEGGENIGQPLGEVKDELLRQAAS